MAQIQLSSQQQQCGGLHPEQRYSVPLSPPTASTSRPYLCWYKSIVQVRRQPAIRVLSECGGTCTSHLVHMALPRAPQTRCSVQRGWLAQTQCRPTVVLVLNPGLCSLTRTRIHRHSHTPRETCRPGRPARIIPGLWSLSVCRSGCAAKHEFPARVPPASGTGTGTATGHALRR